ncbi:MAPEG family protein [Methyloversatilis sp. RAC08]|uniref:MAPEG family protein n=1 Tax=Methyloversatilis sp. RAC08 TaxID=1842540 RepID=UPI00083DFB99|nr:MAPEG family protein [Methyloversatilis sp. RAC08]AOF80387.1 MAPEG family protein [Methyloversatilis sp. RAC08]
MSPSLLAMLLYATLTLLLLVAIAALRTTLVVTRQRAADAFTPAGDDVSPFSGRLCRAHANCCENLPVFAALVLAAALSGHAGITDSTALWVFAARVGQTVTHLSSGRRRAIRLRFLFMLVQIALLTSWVVRLLWVSVQ